MIYPNWFYNNIPIFNEFLNKYTGMPNIKFLQIGAYTGDASLWLLDNILTDKSSTLVDVDTWAGSEELIHKKFDWNDVEDVYNKKLSSYTNVIKYKGTSLDYLYASSEMFDFIYIDGDHTSQGVYSDASLAYPLLKDNGIMAFDDYLWRHHTNSPELEPKGGIDLFLKSIDGQFIMLKKEYQVWIQKCLIK